MDRRSSRPEQQLLSSLTSLTAHWNSLDLQKRVADACGVKLDPAAIRAVYTLGMHGGAASPSALADELQLSRPSTSKLLARLTGLELIERQRDAIDGRASRVLLTQRGRGAFDRLVLAGDQMVQRALADWSREDAVLLAELLTRFVGGLTSDDALPAVERAPEKTQNTAAETPLERKETP